MSSQEMQPNFSHPKASFKNRHDIPFRLWTKMLIRSLLNSTLPRACNIHGIVTHYTWKKCRNYLSDSYVLKLRKYPHQNRQEKLRHTHPLILTASTVPVRKKKKKNKQKLPTSPRRVKSLDHTSDTSIFKANTQGMDLQMGPTLLGTKNQVLIGTEAFTSPILTGLGDMPISVFPGQRLIVYFST